MNYFQPLGIINSTDKIVIQIGKLGNLKGIQSRFLREIKKSQHPDMRSEKLI